MRFEKWEGLGNDFVVVRELACAASISRDLVMKLCDRRRGVGADGVLLLDFEGERGRPRMTVFNADGSRPEMCGNGLRCVAAALGAGTHDVATDAGLRRCAVVGAPRAQDGFEVTVDMGVARREEDLRLRLDDRDIVFLRVDMGNPHAVTFEVSGERALADFGRRVATSIPGGVNAEFCARNAKNEVEVLVWERGVGPTLACGTGACAVAFAACEIGLAERGREQAIRLPGGLLSITVLADARVRMKGPARRVFEGTFAPL